MLIGRVWLLNRLQVTAFTTWKKIFISPFLNTPHYQSLLPCSTGEDNQFGNKYIQPTKCLTRELTINFYPFTNCTLSMRLTVLLQWDFNTREKCLQTFHEQDDRRDSYCKWAPATPMLTATAKNNIPQITCWREDEAEGLEYLITKKVIKTESYKTGPMMILNLSSIYIFLHNVAKPKEHRGLFLVQL